MTDQTEAAKIAAKNERMIEVRLRFWTNGLAEKGSVIPKHAKTSGTIRMRRNDTHGIIPLKSRKFNSLLEINSVVEKVLMEHGIVLHRTKKMKKYIV